MKKPCLFVLLFIFLLLLLSLIKVNTMIYVGDYSRHTRYDFDLILKINDKEILNDSLTNSSLLPNFVIEKKLRNGFHKINVFSNKANVNQEKRIFLLPNQFIYIEFLPADTLTFFQYQIPDSIFFSGIHLTDSIIEQYKLPSRYYDTFFQDTLDFPIMLEKSEFDIRTGFYPFVP